MKKFFALLLTMMMVFSFAACGGDDVEEPVGDDTAIEEELDVDTDEDAGVAIVDKNGDPVTQETINKLSEVYNAIAIPYNDIVNMVNENGWMADEQTAAEMDAVSSTLGFIGTGLTEDLTMLDGTDFEALIDSLENEFPEVLDILNERCAAPYEG